MTERVRQIFFWVHLCLGLAAGVIFLVMCVTGVLVAYRPQLEFMANHWGLSSKPAAPGARPLSIEELAERVRENAGLTPETITLYPGDRSTVDVAFGRSAGVIYADAYTGAILGRPSPAVFGFFAKTMSWHTALGIDTRNPLGQTMIDVGNLVSFIAIVVGVYLWLPRKWTWRHVKAVLFLRPGLTGKARDFNWHNVIGIWALVPLVVMVWSGVAISYRWADQVTVQAVSLVLPRNQGMRPLRAGGADPFSERDPFSARVTGLTTLVERAKQRVPDWKSISFEVPESMTSAVVFTMDPTGYGLLKGGMASRLQLARSGEELGFQPPNPVRGRGVYRFAHTGELWGQWGQTIGTLGCIGGMFLVYTGVALSLRRFLAWRKRTVVE